MQRIIGFMLAVLSLAAVADTHTPTQQAPAGQAVLIMDYSGSMWGRIQGQPKINVARDVVSELIQKWDERVHLGLLMYGHRRKKDCSDIEMTIPLGPVDPNQYTRTLQSFQPKGRTPLSDSLILAADKLDYKNKRASVVLVSDGKETCGLNPCQVAKRLHESGADFTVHLVGYDLNAAEKKAVECIANVTGGKYIDADSASELRDALQEAIQEAATLPNDNLVAVTAPNGPAISDPSITWEIFAEGQADPIVSETGSTISPSLDPGRYVVKAALGDIRTEQAFEVREDKQQDHQISFNAGYVVLNAQTDSNADTSAIKWAISGENLSTTKQAQGLGTRHLLAAGSYSAQANFNGQSSQQSATVIAGKDTTVSADFRSASVATSTAGDVGVIDWIVLDSTNKEIRRQTGNSANFSIPAGTYTIVADDGRAQIKQTVTVAPADSKTLSFIMQGALQMNAMLHDNGPAVSVAWLVTDEQGNTRHQAEGENSKVVLAKGEYTITAIHPLTQATQKILVSPGQDTAAQINLNMGFIELSASETTQGTKALPVNWTIKAKQSAQVIASAAASAPTAAATVMLPKGDYTITASNDRATVSHAVRITAANTAQQHYVLYGTVAATAKTHQSGQEQAVTWRLRNLADGSEQTSKGTAANFIAAPGRYRLEAVHPELASHKTIDVKSGQHMDHTLLVGIGGINLQAFETKRLLKPLKVTWKVQPIDGKKENGRILKERQFTGQNLSMPLAAGRYRVSALHQRAHADTEITVEAGSSVQQHVPVYGIVKASAYDSDPATGKAIKANWTLRNSTVLGAKGKQIADAQSIELVLPADHYELTAAVNSSEQQQAIKVTAGGELNLHSNLNIGYVNATVSRTLDGAPIKGTFVLIDRDGHRWSSDSNTNYQTAIKAGDYILEASNAETMSATQIKVTAGQPSHAHLTLYGVHNFASFKDQRTPLAVAWTIFRKGENKPYKTASGDVASFELPAGNYEYVAQHAAKMQRGTVQVVAGKNQHHTVGMQVGDLTLNAFKTAALRQEISVKWNLEHLASKRRFRAVGPKVSKLLPAGDYRVTADDGHTKATYKLAVTAEKNQQHTAVLYAVHQFSAFQAKTTALPVTWQIFRGVEKQAYKTVKGPIATLALPTGNYQYMATHPAQTRQGNFTVIAAKDKQHVINMGVGRLTANAFKTSAKKAAIPTKWLLEHTSTKRQFKASGTSVNLLLPAGKYRVTANDSRTTEQYTVQVTAEQNQSLEAVLYGVRSVSAYQTVKASSHTAAVTWHVYKDGATRPYVMKKGINSKFLLPSGKYSIVAVHPATTKSLDTTVVAGDMTHNDFGLNIGSMLITAFETGEDDAKQLLTNWELVDSAKNVVTHVGKQLKRTLPAGDYTVKAEHNGVVEAAKVTVIAGNTIKQPLYLYGVVTATARAEAGKVPENIDWKVMTSDAKGLAKDEVYAEITDRARFVLPRGSYQVHGRHDQLSKHRAITVTPGKAEHINMVYNFGDLIVRAWAGPDVPADVQWELRDDKDKVVGKSSINHRQQWTLLPGRYSLTATHDGATKKLLAEVRAGQRNEQDLYLNIARINLNAEQALGRDVHARWTIREIKLGNITGAPVFTGITNKATVELPAGKYQVSAKQTMMNFVKDITLAAGSETSVNAEVDSGYVVIKAVNASSDKLVNVEWQIFDDAVRDGSPIATHLTSNLEMPLPAGRYVIAVRHEGHAQQRLTLHVVAGQRHEHTVFVWDNK